MKCCKTFTFSPKMADSEHPVWTQLLNLSLLQCVKTLSCQHLFPLVLLECLWLFQDIHSQPFISGKSFLLYTLKEDISNISLYPFLLHFLCVCHPLIPLFEPLYVYTIFVCHNCCYCPWPQLWWQISQR